MIHRHARAIHQRGPYIRIQKYSPLIYTRVVALIVTLKYISVSNSSFPLLNPGLAYGFGCKFRVKEETYNNVNMSMIGSDCINWRIWVIPCFAWPNWIVFSLISFWKAEVVSNSTDGICGGWRPRVWLAQRPSTETEPQLHWKRCFSLNHKRSLRMPCTRDQYHSCCQLFLTREPSIVTSPKLSAVKVSQNWRGGGGGVSPSKFRACGALIRYRKTPEPKILDCGGDRILAPQNWGGWVTALAKPNSRF